ncbi:MAG TPA: PmoA family protein [Cyclobacteriaceae bacterium]|nr:PmoA family protein [Cyclobacteriaceae bacterium]
MRILVLFVWMGISIAGMAQRIATFETDLSKKTNDLDVPVSVNLDPITFDADSTLTLSLIEGTKRTPIPFQISRGPSRQIHWTIPATASTKKISFELSKGKMTPSESMKAGRVNGELTIQSGDKNLLRYVYKMVYPPAGQDSAYRRNGFIHPLWTPSGKILTRIQAPDHYHHYGIWNPWTHVLFEGDTVDFWNIKGKQGTVRFSRFVSVTEGPIFAEFAALHEHVVFKKNGKEKVALNELQTVRVYKPGAKGDYYIADITIQLNCAGTSPFKILEYRYAGMGWRATEKWNQSNSEAMTSEGKTRKDADGTTARWFYYQGPLDAAYGGAEMMSYPSNYNFPEPLRIWPENSNNGEVFAMFAPTKNKDWLLEPGKIYTLKYRFVVYDGHFSKEKADRAWSNYAMPPVVAIKK